MLKKITTILKGDRNNLARKVRLIAGVTLGIGIGILLNKPEEEDVVIIEKIVEVDEQTWQDTEPDLLEEGSTQQ